MVPITKYDITMALPPFHHSRLDMSNPRVFRVLEIIPSPSLSGDIQCELHHRTLSTKIRYEALSYAWGEPNPLVNIIINGSSVLGVTKNCYEALLHLRQRFRKRVLWVDAICIDQHEDDESTQERNHQVKFMSEIYANATRVLVWLGCAEPGTTRMIARLRLIGMALGAATRLKPKSGPAWHGYCEGNPLDPLPAEQISRPQWLARVQLFLLQKLAKVLLDGMLSGPRHQSLASLLRSPWWERLWTLQEHIFGQDCEAYLGRQRLHFKFLDHITMQLYRSTPAWLPHPLPNYVARVQIGASSKRMMRFLENQDRLDQHTFQDRLQSARDLVAQTLFVTAFWFNTKRPVDKIFGLYKLLDLCFPSSLPEVDYSKGAAEVFEDVIWAWVQSRSDLSILKLAGRPDSGIDELNVASWVPGWHKHHPWFVNSEGTSPKVLQMNFQRLLLDMPFSWVYTGRREMRTAARIEVQNSGPIAQRISAGKLQILRARYVGRVAHAFGPSDPNHYFDPVLVLCHLIHWCWIVHGTSSPDDLEASITELFGLIYIPGVRPYDWFPPESTEDQLQAFRTWFKFVVYCKYNGLRRSSTSANTVAQPCTAAPDSHEVVNTMQQVWKLVLDVTMSQRCTAVQESYELVNKLQQVARLILDVWLAKDDATAVAALQARYSDMAQGREDLGEISKQIRKLVPTLSLLRGHCLCILDHCKTLAIANTWCQKNDEIFVFPGADTPFLVRRNLESGGYRLVGPVLVERLRKIGYQKWRAEGEGEDLRDITLM